MHTLNNNLYWMANKWLTFISYSQDEYILFSVYIIAYNELHIYNVWTSSVIMIYIHVWFNPEYTQINTKSMLQKDGVFPYGLVDIFMVIDHHCIIILPSERKISYACGYALVCKCDSSHASLHFLLFSRHYQ